MILDQLKQVKNVLILGFAREGQSTYRYLRTHYPHLQIALADQKNLDNLPENFRGQTFFGENYLNCLDLGNWDLVFRSPGISPHLPEIEAASRSGITFTSHTQIFFELFRHQIIGVTGTKGKSTTASLIHHVLHENQIPSVLVGNIGQPALDYISEITPQTWIVMELSSYQLMTVDCSPHIAVLQSIFPDHLDYHKDIDEYQNAKTHIFSFQSSSDFLIYNADNPVCRQLVSRTKPSAKIIPFQLSDYDPVIQTKLLGEHNKYNIIPSVVIGKLLQIPLENIYAALAVFAPLETRLEYIATVKGIRFYADTLATIPEATIAAIDALGLKVNTLIAGGHERKQKYSNLAEKIINSGINTVVLFPETGKRIWSETQKTARRLDTQLPQHFFVESMSEAVNLALHHTASGKICLLSPAAPSFTLFKDYRDEYNQYTSAIKSIS